MGGWGEGAAVGVGRKTARKRAVGTREHIVAYLTEVHELFDANGMASTRLAAAVGYPGSSVAFAQLLSGMERSGLIEREVRGKRTYRISLGSAQAVSPAAVAERDAPTGVDEVKGVEGVAVGAGAAGFDYDELARRLLVQVVRRLAAAEPKATCSSLPLPKRSSLRSAFARTAKPPNLPSKSTWKFAPTRSFMKWRTN